ncbi:MULTISPECIES: TRAP transporter substrate-binding protein [unclassified Bordetella]|uniref:TRAP transporter substrate-binding protein n=1 Tax=unclassified Bordetella TaxID=2630031 RepID=UPI0013227B94|nr:MULTISPECIES: TRAP transporter substrate-binding protein [unclassified Bordetella]MVW70727.1 DctP family TRAP transporter solute-binding subunit [Bordetella sp. 15P40C-2]MVW77601.1 DctP family TRAP transporter solute-binding subunit [Bordetella sp. 02P26C-1]
MKTKLSILAMAAIMALGCGFATVQAKTVKMRMGHTLPETDSQNLAAIEFAKKVKERTNGEVDIKVFPNSVLGNDGALVQGVRSGTIDIGVTGNPFLTGVSANLNVLDLPYLFDNEQQAYKVLDGKIGRGLLDELGQYQLKGLAFWEIGFRSLANSKLPVNSASDIAGLKVRTTPNPAHILAFQALGANPQPLAYGEVFPALETKAVDGHENPPTLMLASKMYEVQKYLSLTRHAYTAGLLFMNKRKFDSLTPEQQQIVMEEAAAAATFQRELNAKNQETALAELKKQGMQINESPDVESIKKVVQQPVRDAFAAKYGDSLLKAIDEQQ